MNYSAELHENYNSTKDVAVLEKYSEWNQSKENLTNISSHKDAFELCKGLLIGKKDKIDVLLNHANKLISVINIGSSVEIKDLSDIISRNNASSIILCGQYSRNELSKIEKSKIVLNGATSILDIINKDESGTYTSKHTGESISETASSFYGTGKLNEGKFEVNDASVDDDYFYDDNDTIKEKIEALATTVYGADGVDYADEASRKIAALQSNEAFSDMGICTVKTHLSLSDNPNLKGRPKGWRLSIHEVMVYQGAGFIVPMAGTISLMPGTASDPNYRKIDVDVNTGKVTGLF
jgi:hypothetical protein